MHRIDTPTAQRDKFGQGKNGFTRGNPQTGTPATQLDYLYCDAMQEEIANAIESAGIKLDKSKHDQLATAIKEFVKKGSVKLNSSTNSESETEAATPLAVKTVNDAAVKRTGDNMTGELNINGRCVLVEGDALPATKIVKNEIPTYEVGDILTLLNAVDFNILPTLKKQNMIGNGVLSKNGYAQIPLFIAGKIQNIVIQWGEGNTDATGRARVTLPISNPNATLFAIAVERDAQAWFSSNSATTWGISAKDSTKSQITICTKGITSGQIVIGSYAYSYLTIGY